MNLTEQLQLLDASALGRRLADSRKRCSLTQQQTADVLKVARTTVVAFEKGDRRVTADELVQLAELYEVELDDVLRPEEPDVQLIVQFRRLLEDTPLFEQDSTSGLDRAVDRLQQHAVDYVRLERMLGRTMTPRFSRPYPLKGVTDLEGYAEEAAHEERRRLNLGDGPIPNLREVLEEGVGLRIFQFPMEGKLSGLYGYAPQLGPCVAINSHHPLERRTQTLAHEYGHVVSDPRNADIQVSRVDRRNSRAERFSGAFGMSFTMTETGIRRQLREYTQHRNDANLTLGDLVYLASRFHVSFEAYIRRLEGLQLLPRGTSDTLRTQKFSVRTAQKQIGIYDARNDARPSTVPDRFAMLAVEAFERELITREQLQQMVALSDEELQPLITSYQMIPVENSIGNMEFIPIDLVQRIPLRLK